MKCSHKLPTTNMKILGQRQQMVAIKDVTLLDKRWWGGTYCWGSGAEGLCDWLCSAHDRLSGVGGCQVSRCPHPQHSYPDHIDCVETKCETTNYLITCDHVQCNVCVPSVTGCLSSLIALTGSNTPPRLPRSRWEVRAKMLGWRGSTFASCLSSINRRVIQQRR